MCFFSIVGCCVWKVGKHSSFSFPRNNGRAVVAWRRAKDEDVRRRRRWRRRSRIVEEMKERDMAFIWLRIRRRRSRRQDMIAVKAFPFSVRVHFDCYSLCRPSLRQFRMVKKLLERLIRHSRCSLISSHLISVLLYLKEIWRGGGLGGGGWG